MREAMEIGTFASIVFTTQCGYSQSFFNKQGNICRRLFYTVCHLVSYKYEGCIAMHRSSEGPVATKFRNRPLEQACPISVQLVVKLRGSPCPGAVLPMLQRSVEEQGSRNLQIGRVYTVCGQALTTSLASQVKTPDQNREGGGLNVCPAVIFKPRHDRKMSDCHVGGIAQLLLFVQASFE